jgi:hypothetical protein
MFLTLMVDAPGYRAPPPRGASLMFLALMVDAPGSRAPTPRGSVVDVSYVDGGRSWISSMASQGGHH